ncbi:MAG: hypothetical protein U0169_22735 [Polyangiaceae bacterium]
MRPRAVLFTTLGLAVAASVLAHCSTPEVKKQPGAWPTENKDDFSTVKLRADVVQPPQAQLDEAKVEPNRLVFPASQAAEVIKRWPAGAPVVGGRRTAGREGNNAFGFVRKVKQVRQEGDTIVVDTEPATLLDVLEPGQMRATVDPRSAVPVDVTGVTDEELRRLFPSPGSGPGVSVDEANGEATPDAGATMADSGASQDTDGGLGTKNYPGLGNAMGGASSGPMFGPFGGPTVRTSDYDGDISYRNMSARFDATEAFNLPNSISQRTGTDIGNGIFTLFDRSFTKTVKLGGKSYTATYVMKARLKSSLYFKPTLHLYIDVDGGLTRGLYLDELQASLKGPFNYKGDLEVAVDIKIPGITDRPDDQVGPPENLVNLLGEIAEGFVAPSKTIKGGIITGPVIAGIPTTYQFELNLDCTGTIKGATTLSSTVSLDAASLGGGITYTDAKGFSYDNPSKMTPKATAKLVGGPIGIDCGIAPTLIWKFADLGGPIVAVRAGVQAEVKGTSECPAKSKTSGLPDLKTTVDFTSDVALQIGADIDAFKFKKSIGPINVYKWPVPAFKLYTASLTQSKAGLGFCKSSCDDKAASADESDVDCGGATCDKCVAGKKCKSPSDCRSGICRPDGVCGGGPCDNGVADGDESGIDCGGSCAAKCADYGPCRTGADCASGICGAAGSLYPNRCVQALCQDGTKNGDESDVDCPCRLPGSSSTCENGRACRTNADCQSGLCNPTTRTCAADTCSDGLLSGDEAAVDCGGSCSFKCATGANCRVDGDCQNGICNRVTKKCAASPCEDGVKNGAETGTDCGGPTCGKCPELAGCLQASDCTSGICSTNQRCAANRCGDGILNDSETGVDCGGPTCTKCGVGATCSSNADCLGGRCSTVTGRCVNSACDDGVKNFTETDVDCGGACRTCTAGKACSTGPDCTSGRCIGGVCASDRCKDQRKNGPENGVDCGSNSGCNVLCATGNGCASDADCISGICNTVSGVCAQSACFDGRKSSGEADVDCGGPCTLKCDGGKTCTQASDCASGFCRADGKCAASHCDNGVKDADETDLDCGGTLCNANPLTKCGVNKVCTSSNDCQSGACKQDGTCAANQCSDGTKNGQETDLDCGGATCRPTNPCATGQACLVGADCANGACHANTKLCVASVCGDLAKSGDETDVDCGGSTCTPRCDQGKGCNVNSDCAPSPGYGVASCNVLTHQCMLTFCGNGQRDGDETDLDCGGSQCRSSTPTGVPGSPRKCGISQGCSTHADCQSDYCAGGFCAPLPPPSPKSCREWYTQLKQPGQTVPSGPYKIQHAPKVSSHPRDDIQVYCDMSDAGFDGSGRGGWTLVGVYSSKMNASWDWPAEPHRFLGAAGPSGGGYGTTRTPEEVTVDDYVTSTRDWVHLMQIDWSEMRWAAYYRAARTYMSRPIPRSDIRVAPPLTMAQNLWNTSAATIDNDQQGGYLIYGGTSNYYWCAGGQPFTDLGLNAVLPPAGAPRGCKNHGYLLNGYDFGEQTANAGLTFSGAGCTQPGNPGSCVPQFMSSSYGGTLIYGTTYPRADVAAHAVWAY